MLEQIQPSCLYRTVNHLVGGSSPSRGARKYEGLAVLSQLLFLFGSTVGALPWLHSFRFSLLCILAQQGLQFLIGVSGIPGINRISFPALLVSLCRVASLGYTLCQRPSEGNPLQAQGIGYHGHRRKTHGRGGDNGTEEDTEPGVKHAGGDGYPQAVVQKGEKQILLDVAQGGPGKHAGPDNTLKIPLHQGDPGALYGHVGAGAHGDAHLGLGPGPGRR
jgi:hypothetical protein